MDGIKNQISPPPAHEGMAYGTAVSADSSSSSDLLLPTSLEASLQALEADSVITEALGEQFIRWFKALKLSELSDKPTQLVGESVEEYERRVHTWCRDMYNEFM